MCPGPAVLGVDGCPGGWVGAFVQDGSVAWHTGSFAELLTLPALVVAVDIPIGLPAGALRRAADVEAKAALGAQRSSVFFAPPRVVLEATSQPEATLLSRAAGSVGVSIQTFHILDKVAEVDDLLQNSPDARVVEVHPEVSLRRMGEGRLGDGRLGEGRLGEGHLAEGRLGEAQLGGVALPPKRKVAGRVARLALLRTWLPTLSLPTPLPGRARPDDCLDAIACACSATRWLNGEAEVLGDEVDELGTPMRIVV